MEKSTRLQVVVLVFVMVVVEGSKIEKPQYQIVHAESDFEVRLYGGASTWMAAPASQISFQKATLDGFHRLFQYIQGANLNWSRIPMTAPVITSIVPGAGPFQSSSYSVLFYLPAKFQDEPPVPLPELHLKPYVWESHCVAVRKFSGYAKDDNIIEEAKRLAESLSRSPLANATSADSHFAYSIAQYDAPFRFIGRVNEVWADINGCGDYNQVSAY
ncbi:SOUL heme-binding family protein [Euphorbia peplus]|nr:SOUL heme-binding family protein [Euphorbia peplus]